MNFKPDDFKPKKPNEGEDGKLQPNGDLDQYMNGLMDEADRREAAEEDKLAHGNAGGFSLN